MSGSSGSALRRVDVIHTRLEADRETIVPEALRLVSEVAPVERRHAGESPFLSLDFRRRMHVSAESGVPLLDAFSFESPGVLALEGASVEGAFQPELLASHDPAFLVAKRLIDMVGAAIGLVVAAPFLFVIAVLIKLTSPGPIFYCHTRVGLRGEEFSCLKFRTMVRDADRIKSDLEAHNAHGDQRTFKMPNDPRITRVGRFLRRTSLDEFPQLLNVLVGDMSLVGPRPALPSEIAQYSAEDRQRLEVKPGLTCIWQVSGRSNIAFPEQLEMDLQYIRNQSLALDLKLIALTIPAVLSADGAY